MLHIISSSPYQTQAFQQCVPLVTENDAILLIQDAVIAAVGQNSAFEAIKNTGVKIYLLAADLTARGLGERVCADAEIIDYKGFVSLTVTHETQMKWG
ncbi:sulfurtransferase complex subunit TusB [Photobacterium sanctipauli]|uniref:Sulfurtransferase complex subunit TusB n=1 Tax=Photobacterium sanctipauli TaxID=1342794 RepID=A0A2T3NSF6_9GAMM|nr:sulfurtransferase complex subunit TusB [Photobacterium sanctipauli]PSW19200.1 sulfurtransferase complex subunit TusB [Photobacterium sanctipauli]